MLPSTNFSGAEEGDMFGQAGRRLVSMFGKLCRTRRARCWMTSRASTNQITEGPIGLPTLMTIRALLLTVLLSGQRLSIELALNTSLALMSTLSASAATTQGPGCGSYLTGDRRNPNTKTGSVHVVNPCSAGQAYWVDIAGGPD